MNWLDSAVFLNRGDHFEARPLPVEAQFAPAFGICAADFDGDGDEDIFLAQNFFETDGETSRYDAGRGLFSRQWPRGFISVAGQESGLLIYGAQRGAAACDYDGDGRIDLGRGSEQRGDETVSNQQAKPGLRVRLQGAAGNPTGRWRRDSSCERQNTGPTHEIHAGSGYWSQDSATMVLAGSGDQIWIRWPGGEETKSKVPSGSQALVIRRSGEVLVER